MLVIHTGECTGEAPGPKHSSVKRTSRDVTDPQISVATLAFVIALGVQGVC